MKSRRDRWNQRYAATELVWSAGPNRFLEQEVSGLAPGRALDLACGEGRNAIWLAEQGWHVTAVDFSDVAIDKGRAIAKRRDVEVDWIVADAAEYEPCSGFDLVAILYLHTGPEEREQWMRHAREAVADGGLLLYIGHDLTNIEHGVGGPQHPEVLPTPQDVAGMLPGFEIERGEVVERHVEGEPGHPGQRKGIARDALVRARKLRPTS
jgi:SAM-dependent methyltransferase